MLQKIRFITELSKFKKKRLNWQMILIKKPCLNKAIYFNFENKAKFKLLSIIPSGSEEFFLK